MPVAQTDNDRCTKGIEVEPGPTPLTEDSRTEENEASASRDNRVPATVREDELAEISTELADSNRLTAKELADSNKLLAKEAQASAELLAKTTQASAELLATITQAAADQLRRSNEITTRLTNRLTIILVGLGLIQIAITAIALFARPN